MTDTNLAQAVEATQEAAAYDNNVKFLLADKQILAWILKYTVREFQDMPIEEIIASIGDDIEVASVAVDPGLTNLGQVKEDNREDNIPGEGKIFFDIRFHAYHKEAELKFLINIEAQKSTKPGRLGYHLENRIIFYLSRMISAQKQKEFYGIDYDNIKRVRSIWICMDNGKNADSIEEINLVRKTVFGNKADGGSIELMQGIIINIREGKNIRASRNKLIRMLEELLSGRDAEEKKKILAEEFGMVMSVEMEGRVKSMCNLSENILERGLSQGELKQSRQCIFDLLEDLGEIPRDICDRINIEEDTEVLRKWHKAAARTESFAIFRKTING